MIAMLGGLSREMTFFQKKGKWTKTWTKQSSSRNEVQVMYTQKEIKNALKIYVRLYSQHDSVRLLGSPSLIQLRELASRKVETG